MRCRKSSRYDIDLLLSVWECQAGLRDALVLTARQRAAMSDLLSARLVIVPTDGSRAYEVTDCGLLALHIFRGQAVTLCRIALERVRIAVDGIFCPAHVLRRRSRKAQNGQT